jgi:hypothetical protein
VGPGGVGIGGPGEAGLHVGVGEAAQVVAEGVRHGDGCQALVGVVVVGLEVLGEQVVERLTPLGGELPLFLQDLTERPGLVEHPGLHGGEQGVAADEVHLQGQHAVEQVAIGAALAGHGLRHGWVLQGEGRFSGSLKVSKIRDARSRAEGGGRSAAATAEGGVSDRSAQLLIALAVR